MEITIPNVRVTKNEIKMKHLFGITPLSLLFFLINFNLFAQVNNNYATKIDSLIKTINIRPFNGVVLISENGKTKYAKAYGFANFEKKSKLNLDNQFEIMSNSKQITAVLILREVEKGKINLQQPIKKYLPNLTQPWADSVTVHQLLNHTHGIVDVKKPLLFKPGSAFKYGDVSNILLGKIIEFSSKKSYSETANDLFRKLNMKNTFAYSKEKMQHVASGHSNKENIFTVIKSTGIKEENIPAHGIISTVKDLVTWNNNLHHGKILNKESYKLMTTPSALAQHNVFGKENVGYGYGIRICENEKPKYIGHTGLGDGFASVNLYFPKSNTSLIVLENQMNEKLELCYYFGIEIKKIIQNNLNN
jgi:D-alanyl-D-alanine carboxypeptidase